MSLGDPAFGATFEAMRDAVVDAWVLDHRGKWECLRCKRRWTEIDVPPAPDNGAGSREHHAPDCLLGLTPHEAL